MTASARRAARDAARPRARRARPASRSAPTRGSAACCSTPTAATVAEGYHRGAGTPHAEADALARAGDGRPRAPPPSSPSSPATTPAAPARARRRWSTPAYAAWSSPSPTPTRSPPAAPRRLRAAGVEVEGGLLADEARALNRAGPSPSSTAGRSSPGSSPPPSTAAAPPPTAPAAGSPARAARRDTHRLRGAVRRDAGRHRHRRGRRPAADRPRRATTGRCARQPLRAVMGQRDLARRPAGLRRRAPRPCTCAPATRTRRSPSCSPATGSTSSSRAARPWPRRSCAAGLVDEVVAYVAPMLLGAGPHRRRPTWASPPSPTRCDLDGHRRDRRSGADGRDANVRLTMTPSATRGETADVHRHRRGARHRRAASRTRATPSGSPSARRTVARATPGSATRSPSTAAA